MSSILSNDMYHESQTIKYNKSSLNLFKKLLIAEFKS